MSAGHDSDHCAVCWLDREAQFAADEYRHGGWPKDLDEAADDLLGDTLAGRSWDQFYRRHFQADDWATPDEMAACARAAQFIADYRRGPITANA